MCELKLLHILVGTLEFLLAVATVSVASHDLQCPATGMVPTDGLAVDEQILLAFKREVVRDPGNELQDWDSSVSNVCNWSHVTCDRHRNRVSQLNLPSLGLEGSLTPMLGCLEFLKTIDLTNNSFSGSIPSGLFRSSSNLEEVLFGINNFNGSVPDSVGNCLALTELKLGRNSLSGNISKSLTSLSNLRVLDLSSNKLTGDIPHIRKDGCKSLERLDLSSNQIQGSIPESLRECSNLFLFNLSNNVVTGPVPSWLSELRNLSQLNLSYNKLEGGIPLQLFDLGEKLGELHLQGNLLNGTLTDSFNGFRLLNLLDVSSNFLSGVVPRSLGSCQSLIELSLSNNRFTGSIPEEIGYLSSFQLTLNLSNNRLDGSIPASLGSLGSLLQLDLSANYLTGQIPPSLGNCTNLHFLDLSNNNLVGEIPLSLCSLKSHLLYFNATGNKLTDFIQDWLSVSCKGSTVPVIYDGTSNNVWRLLYASLFGIVAVASALSSVFIWIYWVKKPYDLHVRELAAWHGVELEVIRLTIEDLLSATDSFSTENIIGYGSSGTVYKGVLPVFPFVIAVKKFDDDLQGRQRLEREAKVMRLIRHRNLVRGLGARSSDPGSQLPELNVLVLEYMENGTLDQLLYSDPVSNFSWDMRVDVAVNVATGLCYLHEDVGNHIQLIHGDIKPSNIFLNSSFVASIGDFGLARLAVNGKATAGGCWEGTLGYCPPEIGQGYMSTAGDVYSFGVVLLEMLVRRRPTSFDVETTGWTFVPWIRDSFPDNLNQIIDRTLASELESNLESVTLLFKLGLLCTVGSPWDRPTMKEALAMVKMISSGIRNEPEVTASPIEVLAHEHVVFPHSAHLRNAQSLMAWSGLLHLDEYLIDIYDPSGKHGASRLSGLYRSSASAETSNDEEVNPLEALELDPRGFGGQADCFKHPWTFCKEI